MKNIDVVNVGFTETILQDNKKKYINKVEWKGKYDGENAVINISMNDNGHKENTKIYLDNDEIINMLNYPSINKPIDKRLIEDYLSKTKSNKKRMSGSTKRKSIKRKGKRKHKNKTKSMKL